MMYIENKSIVFVSKYDSTTWITQTALASHINMDEIIAL